MAIVAAADENMPPDPRPICTTLRETLQTPVRAWSSAMIALICGVTHGTQSQPESKAGRVQHGQRYS